MSDNPLNESAKPVINLRRADADKYTALNHAIHTCEDEMTQKEGELLIWAVEAQDKTTEQRTLDDATQVIRNKATDRFNAEQKKKKKPDPDAKITYTEDEQKELDELIAKGRAALNPFLNSQMSYFNALREVRAIYDRRNVLEQKKIKLLQVFNKHYRAEMILLRYQFDEVDGVMYLNEPERFPEQTQEGVKAYNEAVAKRPKPEAAEKTETEE